MSAACEARRFPYSLIIGLLVIMVLAATLGYLWHTANSDLYLRSGWQYRWVDEGAAAANAPWASAGEQVAEGWRPYSFGQRTPDWDGRSVLWLRSALPDKWYERPILYLTLVSHHVECWLDGRRVYGSGAIPVPPDTRYNPWYPIHVIYLPEDAAGKEVHLVLHSGGSRIGLISAPRGGGLDEFLASRAWMDFFKIGSGALCFFTAAIALVLGFRRHGGAGYFAYAGGAICSGLIVMAGVFGVTRAIDHPTLSLFLIVPGILFWQGFWLWFLETMVATDDQRFVRLIRNTVFCLAAGMLLLIWHDTGRMHTMLYVILAETLLGFFLMLYVFRHRLRTDEETRIYAIGAVAWVTAMVFDAMKLMGLIDLSTTVSVLGQLMDVFCQAVILTWRINAVYSQREQLTRQIHDRNVELNLLNQQINDVNSNLEVQVADRTKELQQAALILQDQKEKLERSEQARQRLLSNIAHDLRTPITLIRGHVEAVLEGVASEGQQQARSLRIAHDKALRLQKLVEDFFTLCQLEARALKVQPQTVAVSNWLDDINASFADDVNAADIALRITADSAAAAVEVRIDRQRMERVFGNLIYNAVKYTPAGGCITVDAQLVEGGQEVVLSVQDTGIGIARGDIEKIFQRFYSGRGAGDYSGSSSAGLGLAIAREIVEMHGGRIWADSEVGRGSTFYVALPVTGSQQSDG